MKKSPEETIHIHHMGENGGTYFQFSTENTSSIQVRFPASYVSLPGCIPLAKISNGFYSFINVRRENGGKTLGMDGTLAV